MSERRNRFLIAGEMLPFTVPVGLPSSRLRFCRLFSASMTSWGRGRRLSLLVQQRCASFPHACDLTWNTS
jgi:hypothetical protein